MKTELTHDLDFESSSCAVSLSIACNTGVGCLIAETFDVLDNEGSVREDFLLPVDGKNASVPLPDDTLNGISSYRASYAKSLTGHDRFLVHVTNERQAINVETC